MSGVGHWSAVSTLLTPSSFLVAGYFSCVHAAKESGMQEGPQACF